MTSFHCRTTSPGVLRVTSTADIAIVALRLRVNENGEIKVTTLAPSNEMDPPTSENRFFAHLADSGGWSTQLILFSGTAGQASSGTLRFIDTQGKSLDLAVAPTGTEVLELDDNDLTGPIPPELGALANLTWLDLSDNGLTGPIPAQLGGLESLREMVLSRNARMSGALPDRLTDLPASSA